MNKLIMKSSDNRVRTKRKLSRAFHEKSSEISLCSIILNLAEDTNVIFEQKATYPANMFISDIGGSAGLILGIHKNHG